MVKDRRTYRVRSYIHIISLDFVVPYGFVGRPRGRGMRQVFAPDGLRERSAGHAAAGDATCLLRLRFCKRQYLQYHSTTVKVI